MGEGRGVPQIWGTSCGHGRTAGMYGGGASLWDIGAGSHDYGSGPASMGRDPQTWVGPPDIRIIYTPYIPQGGTKKKAGQICTAFLGLYYQVVGRGPSARAAYVAYSYRVWRCEDIMRNGRNVITANMPLFGALSAAL